MTRFVSLVSLVSLNHPVIHRFHGPISDSRMLIQGLGSIYSRDYLYKIQPCRSMTWVGQIFGFTFLTPPRCLFCHDLSKRKSANQKAKKKDAEKRK
ncbi:hypothetical protein N7447_004856 [Penicillium robsamsonii]|uniref:uncharacterized protein n=1 Tax=Penicillium robsamsonii TaxID=1792511 RepID=UPI00254900A0|nr:uncharacterized protein N7447_004856 [Penicillium robsamsonii]KAJ5822516.1 hypothetical protein N7447_004856 [Penicillium robsamsonii]